MLQVGGQTVRKVHHGAHLGTAAEPDAFGDLRLRVAVHGGRGGVAASREDVLQACSRGSEFPGGEDHVPGACVAASLEVRVGRAADGRDVDRQARQRAGRVAPGERHAELLGQFPVAEHELCGPRIGGIGRKGDREQRRHGAGAHCSHVAQVYGEGFASQLAGRGRRAEKMNPFGQQVRGEDQRFAAADRQHGAVVADALESVVGKRGEKGFYAVDESEFGHGRVVLWRKVTDFFGEFDYLCPGIARLGR